jgi:hypothetical protein
MKNNLRTVSHKATGVLCNIFPLLARDSTVSQKTRTTFCTLHARSTLTYTAPVWYAANNFDYLKLQVTDHT